MIRKFVILILFIGFPGLLVPLESPAEDEPRVVTLKSRVEQGAKIWSPEKVFLKKGETVTIRLENHTEVVHGFSIDEFKVKTEVMGGKTRELEFKAKKRGVYRFYCHIHRAHQGGEMTIE